MRLAITATAILLTLAGCSGSEQAERGNAQEPADTKIVTPQGTAEIRTGNVSGANLPGGLPAYPNASAGGGMDISGSAAGAQGRVVSFQTPDQPAQVMDFYANAAQGAGFQVAARAQMGPAATLTLQRGTEAIQVVATGAGQGSQVQIAAGSQ